MTLKVNWVIGGIGTFSQQGLLLTEGLSFCYRSIVNGLLARK